MLKDIAVMVPGIVALLAVFLTRWKDVSVKKSETTYIRKQEFYTDLITQAGELSLGYPDTRGALPRSTEFRKLHFKSRVYANSEVCRALDDFWADYDAGKFDKGNVDMKPLVATLTTAMRRDLQLK